MSVFYHCNGMNPCCCHCEGCFTRGGQCDRTTNVKYAKTEICKDPWNHPERFEVDFFPNTDPVYWERYPDDTVNDNEEKEIDTDDEEINEE